MNLLLEKALRVLAQASKNNAYSCPSEVTLPEYLQQEDVDVLETTFLQERLNADAVTQMTNDVFQKLMNCHRLDEIIQCIGKFWNKFRNKFGMLCLYCELQIILQKKLAAEAFDYCRNTTQPNFILVILKLRSSSDVNNCLFA